MKNQYIERYESMTDQEKRRNYLALDLDMVIGGKPDLLLELLSVIQDENELSLTLRRIITDLKMELGVN